MLSSGARSGFALVQKMPAVTSSESPGQEEADQQAGLREDDRRDQGEAADLDDPLHVVNPVEQVHEVLHRATTLGQAGPFVTFEMG